MIVQNELFSEMNYHSELSFGVFSKMIVHYDSSFGVFKKMIVQNDSSFQDELSPELSDDNELFITRRKSCKNDATFLSCHSCFVTFFYYMYVFYMLEFLNLEIF